jgi:hypothetical protein
MKDKAYWGACGPTCSDGTQVLHRLDAFQLIPISDKYIRERPPRWDGDQNSKNRSNNLVTPALKRGL